MKLLGVEFTNLALLKHQYIPLNKPITLLVGKNNAGKSSILRALSALKGLPNNAPSSELNQYSTGVPVGVNVFFEAEKQDNHGIVTNEEWWNEFIEKKHPTAMFRFASFSESSELNKIGFESASLHVPGGGEWMHLEVRDGNLVLRPFSAPSSTDEMPTESIQAIGQKLVSQTMNATHAIPEPSPLFSGMEQLQSLFVAPHRVVGTGMRLTSQMNLGAGGNELAQFLHTLQSNDRRRFGKIETFVTTVFNQFESVNPRSVNDQVNLTLTVRGNGADVPLDRCGTGVEQMLTIATQIVRSEPGTIILLDEPHSFLHPDAERKLMRFLEENHDKRFVIATHSAVMMNAVSSDSIVYIEPPGRSYSEYTPPSASSKLLLDLGYRNSDVLFHDRLIIGEGATEREVLPILLETCGFDSQEIDRTGFCTLDGAPHKSKAQQTAVGRFEKLLAMVGRIKQPRVYLFDLDRSPDDETLLRKTKPEGENESAPIIFLPRMEIENYLLVPGAIADAIREELPGGVSDNLEEDVAAILKDLYERVDDSKLFPKGKTDEPDKHIKGGRALERLYDRLGVGNYNKARTGRLIAGYVTKENQLALKELEELFRPLFSSTSGRGQGAS